ncbi:thioredoxin family protein [Mucilaginibacter conchicola]|uniref:Thioredoxin family protein n=1 Tax=Mucilaginibacter conchicola TaxID=2303333 RepID=A0A372NP39_9SPHI|nr:thioredoxin family protein [Mucilaginibacter conchicola]RFZ90704.1 thioredoxin family protein [Mucilaginibacter conchicola]
MNYAQYQSIFDTILNSEDPVYPYNDPEYLKYVKLNKARMNRWDKQLVLSEELLRAIGDLTKPQQWIIITEPWCGDAAHTLPFMIKMAGLNDKISYDIQLRDSEPFLINSYLTGTAKSIPKFVVRDSTGADVFVWGPRPQAAQKIYNDLKALNADHDVISEALQQWYNQNKGVSFMDELTKLLSIGHK